MRNYNDPYALGYEQARKRRAWWIIGGTLAAIAVAAILIVLFGRGSDDPATAEQPTTPAASTTPKPSPSTSTSSAPSVDAAASVCGLPAGDQAIPTTAPAATWELVGTMAIPTDPKIGPGTTAEGLHTCYAHSPTGALFAAVSVMAESQDTTLNQADVLTARAVPGAGLDAALAAIASMPAPEDLAQDRARTQVVGYTVVSATDAVAVINLAISNLNGMASITVTMQWFEGDWRMALPPSGGWASEPIANLVGYTSWGGA